MTRPPRPTSVDPEGRLDAVARLLAAAILRRRMRHSRTKSRASLSGQNPLDLVPNSSAHVVETSRNGEDR